MLLMLSLSLSRLWMACPLWNLRDSLGAETDSVQIPRKIQFLRFGGDRSVWYFELCILCRCRAVIVSLKNAAFILLELALRLQSGEQLNMAAFAAVIGPTAQMPSIFWRRGMATAS